MYKKIGLLVLILIGLLAVIGASRIVYQRMRQKDKMPMYQITNRDDVAKIFAQTPKQINDFYDHALEDAQQKVKDILAIPADKRTFANTAQAFDSILANSYGSTLQGTALIIEMAHPDEEMRKTAQQTMLKLAGFAVEHVTNSSEMYRAFKEYMQGQAKHEKLTDAQKYFLEEVMRTFKRAGLDLPQEQCIRVKQLKNEVMAASIQFETNIACDSRSITATRAELEGVHEDVINSLKKNDDGTYIVTTDTPTYQAVIEHCVVPETRKKIFLAYTNRGYPANDAVLKDVIAKRDELAKLLGYASYAHMDIDDEMAATPERAAAFLDKLHAQSSVKEQQEFQQLIKELPASVQLIDGKLAQWDAAFVRAHYKKKHLNIDEREVAEYFPMEKSVKGLFAVYEKFFSIRFAEVPAHGLWHPEVTMLEVYRADDNQLLGYFLLDLYPRPNKYTHAAHSTVIPSLYDQKGQIKPAVSMVIANFPRSTQQKPSLLKRDDVGTFFHEFGHALHALFGRTYLGTQSGTSVKTDFVEMPSQMLEEWLWDKEILKMVSSHYKTGAPLSDELIDRLIQSKNLASGNTIQTQCFYSMLSLQLYGAGAHKEPHTLQHQLFAEKKPNYLASPDDHFYAAFGHLIGYGAKYYGYMWSKVFALDLFDHIKKHGLLDPVIGQTYKNEVIGKGGSKDPNELIKKFLGREPNQEAFLHDLGL